MKSFLKQSLFIRFETSFDEQQTLSKSNNHADLHARKTVLQVLQN
jgi:hypothetical protein